MISLQTILERNGARTDPWAFDGPL